MMFNTIKILTLAFLALGLSACNLAENRLAMTPADMTAPPTSGSLEYRLGWEHGCKSGLGAFGSDIQRVKYKFTMDLDFAQNKTYMRSWRDSFRYCRSFMNREMRDGYLYGEGGGSSDARGKNAATKGSHFHPLFKGFSTPGWGDMAWGANAKSNDWLGRAPEDTPDWLGRTPANR